VKLIDFNLSAAIHFKEFGWNKLKTHCGTIEYAAPELLTPQLNKQRCHYEGPPVDSWCLGVLLYIMLVGRFPFEEPDRRNKILVFVFKLLF
jgi:carbon catabolite-derepressing protein kinase